MTYHQPHSTLVVPEYLRPRIEAAHRRIEELHPGGPSLQELVEVFILGGLEAIEIEILHEIAFRRATGQVKPGVIERLYDDGVQAPLTASEQGRD